MHWISVPPVSPNTHILYIIYLVYITISYIIHPIYIQTTCVFPIFGIRLLFDSSTATATKEKKDRDLEREKEFVWYHVTTIARCPSLEQMLKEHATWPKGTDARNWFYVFIFFLSSLYLSLKSFSFFFRTRGAAMARALFSSFFFKEKYIKENNTATSRRRMKRQTIWRWYKRKQRGGRYHIFFLFRFAVCCCCCGCRYNRNSLFYILYILLFLSYTDKWCTCSKYCYDICSDRERDHKPV